MLMMLHVKKILTKNLLDHPVDARRPRSRTTTTMERTDHDPKSQRNDEIVAVVEGMDKFDRVSASSSSSSREKDLDLARFSLSLESRPPGTLRAGLVRHFSDGHIWYYTTTYGQHAIFTKTTEY